ncbi:MAG TPA: proton-conducting transporter membrane subunit [Pantanalinema sp.]
MPSLLPVVLLLPLIGAGAIAMLSSVRRDWLAVGVTALALLLALAVALPFDPRGGWQSHVLLDWFPSIGIAYRLGLDGLGLHFVVLTFLLGFAASVAAWRAKVNDRLTLVALLLVQAGAGLAFASRDLFLFLAGWQVALGAVTMILARHVAGGTASKFRLFTGVSSALVLASLLVLYLLNGTNADVVLLHQNHPAAVAPLEMQRLIFGVLAAGFAVQMPLAPWHPWLLDALEELPAPVAALLAGAVAPLGVFGLIRYGLAVMPGPAQDLAPALVFLGLVSVVYGLWGALAPSYRRRVACVAVASAGATVSALGAFQVVTIHAALLLLAITGIGLPAWILAADAWPRLASDRRKWLVAGAVLVVILWPLATAGILAGFAAGFAPLVGL